MTIEKAIKDAEREIQRIILELENGHDIRVDSVDIYYRNDADFRVYILFQSPKNPKL